MMRLYAEISDDDPKRQRAEERDLLMRAVELIDTAAAGGPPMSAAWIEAVAFTHRLWSALIGDLARPDNALPEELRARLISIGLFVLKTVEEFRSGRCLDLSPVRDATRDIAEALA